MSGFNSPCRKLPHHLPQDLSYPRRLGLLQYIQFQNVVLYVRPDGCHLFVAENVPPGQLDKATALRQTGQAGLDEAFTCKAVQHHVHALAAGGCQDILAKRGRAAIENVLDADRPEICLLGRAGRGVHFGAGGLGQLDRRQTYAARARVNQHPVSRLQARSNGMTAPPKQTRWVW